MEYEYVVRKVIPIPEVSQPCASLLIYCYCLSVKYGIQYLTAHIFFYSNIFIHFPDFPKYDQCYSSRNFSP